MLSARSAAQRIVEHLVEPAGRQVRERGLRQRMAEQALRRHHDKRAHPGPERLAAEQVEVLRRRGAVGHPDVVLRGELEEALEPRARMLRSLALVAVRQQQHQPRAPRPTSTGRRSGTGR